MIPNPARFDEANARFDAIHAEDPERERAEGSEQAKELLYAQRMRAWLQKVAPDAGEALRLAAGCQHLRRWSIRRDAYPQGVDGYRKWRTDEARVHAETARQILEQVGYDGATIARVGALVRKEGLKRDPEAQLLEDVACIVFVAHYLEAFARKHDEASVVRILRKSWNKMSPRGHRAVLDLAVTDPVRALLEKALSPVS